MEFNSVLKELSQRLLRMRITESEKLDKMKLETEIWVYQKWDGIVRALAGVGKGGMWGLVDGQLGQQTHQLTNKQKNLL